MEQITNEQIDLVMAEYTIALKESIELKKLEADVKIRAITNHKRLLLVKEAVHALKIEY